MLLLTYNLYLFNFFFLFNECIKFLESIGVMFLPENKRGGDVGNLLFEFWTKCNFEPSGPRGEYTGQPSPH